SGLQESANGYFLRRSPTIPFARFPAVYKQDKLIVGGYFNVRRARRLVRWQFKEATKIARGHGRAVRRVPLGKPNPLRPAEIVGFLAAIPADPFSPPIVLVQQSH